MRKFTRKAASEDKAPLNDSCGFLELSAAEGREAVVLRRATQESTCMGHPECQDLDFGLDV